MTPSFQVLFLSTFAFTVVICFLSKQPFSLSPPSARSLPAKLRHERPQIVHGSTSDDSFSRKGGMRLLLAADAGPMRMTWDLENVVTPVVLPQSS